MKVLVTGAGGFVGRHVVKELSDKHELFTPSREELDWLNYQRSDWDCDFSDLENYTDYLQHYKIEAIIHLAATCGGIGINKDNPGRFIYENLQMGLNVFEAARRAGVKKIVNLGTVCSYPKFTDVPFKEFNIWNGYPEETNAPYGIAKKTIMEVGRAYSAQYGINVTNLVPVNMAGEWDNFDEYSSHVIPALIKKFETNKDIINLWGTGRASREFLYAGDCAIAIGIALEKKTTAEPINLGTGHEITIKDLAELVKQIGGYDVEIEWDSSKPDGQPRRSLSTQRAKEILRWEATTSLEDILRKTITWYKNNHD